MTAPPAANTPALRCLGGATVAQDIVADLALLGRLPAVPRRQIYRALGPCLPEPVPPNAQAEAERFVAEFRLSAGELSRGLRAARFLLRQAARANVSAADFAADLVSLGDTGELAECLVPGYDAAKALVRQELTTARAALLEHGKVVERVAWRVDEVTHSSAGELPRSAVVLLTLGYREGDQREQITLQLGNEALAELRSLLKRVM